MKSATRPASWYFSKYAGSAALTLTSVGYRTIVFTLWIEGCGCIEETSG